MELIAIISIIFTVIAIASANDATIHLFQGSSSKWLSIGVDGASNPIQKVQIKDSSVDSLWQEMSYNELSGQWTYFAGASGFYFPISFQIITGDGRTILAHNVVYSFTNEAQTFGATTVEPTTTTTKDIAADSAEAETTDASVEASTAAVSSDNVIVVNVPVVSSEESSSAPAADSPVIVDSSVIVAPVDNIDDILCSAPLKVMVPLYVYPGEAWDQVTASGKDVPTVAIINVNSGPGNGPDSSYTTYMEAMAAAGVEIVGYVHTSWGSRPIEEVKADIDIWAAEFPLVTGIFLDESATTPEHLPYYAELYLYIMALPGYQYDIINPGVVPHPGYYKVSTQMVAMENYGSEVINEVVPEWGSCASKEHFVAMAHTTNSTDMTTVLTELNDLGYFGWVYVTDGLGGCCTYNELTTYYTEQATFIKTEINKWL